MSSKIKLLTGSPAAGSKVNSTSLRQRKVSQHLQRFSQMGSCTTRRRRRCNIESVKAMTKHGHVTLKSWLVPLHTHARTQAEGRITGELKLKKTARFPLLPFHEEIIQQFIRHRCLGNQTQYQPHSLATPFRRDSKGKNVYLICCRRIFRLESSNSLKFRPFVSHSLIGNNNGPQSRNRSGRKVNKSNGIP